MAVLPEKLPKQAQGFRSLTDPAEPHSTRELFTHVNAVFGPLYIEHRNDRLLYRVSGRHHDHRLVSTDFETIHGALLNLASRGMCLYRREEESRTRNFHYEFMIETVERIRDGEG